MHNLKITDVRALPGDSAFLIDDGHTAILYDSGFGFTGFEVAENIRKILGDRPLDYIFLTHSHYDHALGSAYISHIYKEAKIVAGEYASKIFAKDSAKNVMRDLDRKFAQTCGIEIYEDLADNLRVDIAVSDGDKITAGDMDFIAIHLPGHTRCSVGYYCKGKKLLLSCETIGVYGGNGIVVPSYLVGIEMTMDSIEKVKNLDIDYILTPHYGILDKDESKKFLNVAETNARDVAETISQMIKSGNDDKEIFEYFKNRFYHGYIESIYPIDAMELNTNIMIKLIKEEL